MTQTVTIIERDVTATELKDVFYPMYDFTWSSQFYQDGYHVPTQCGNAMSCFRGHDVGGNNLRPNSDVRFHEFWTPSNLASSPPTAYGMGAIGREFQRLSCTSA